MTPLRHSTPHSELTGNDQLHALCLLQAADTYIHNLLVLSCDMLYQPFRQALLTESIAIVQQLLATS